LQSDCQQNWNELRKNKETDLFTGHRVKLSIKLFFPKQFSWLFYYPKTSVISHVLVRNSGQRKHIEKVEDRNEKSSS
jgi:hypothetical protein